MHHYAALCNTVSTERRICQIDSIHFRALCSISQWPLSHFCFAEFFYLDFWCGFLLLFIVVKWLPVNTLCRTTCTVLTWSLRCPPVHGTVMHFVCRWKKTWKIVTSMTSWLEKVRWESPEYEGEPVIVAVIVSRLVNSFSVYYFWWNCPTLAVESLKLLQLCFIKLHWDVSYVYQVTCGSRFFLGYDLWISTCAVQLPLGHWKKKNGRT